VNVLNSVDGRLTHGISTRPVDGMDGMDGASFATGRVLKWLGYSCSVFPSIMSTTPGHHVAPSFSADSVFPPPPPDVMRDSASAHWKEVTFLSE